MFYNLTVYAVLSEWGYYTTLTLGFSFPAMIAINTRVSTQSDIIECNFSYFSPLLAGSGGAHPVESFLLGL